MTKPAPLVTVASIKGGVGKTTVCLNFAAALVSVSRSVVVVDADLVTPNVDDYLHLDTSDGPTLTDVLAGNATIFDAVRTTEAGFDTLLAGSPRQTATGRVERLARLVDVLKREYDLVIVDTPPAMGFGTIAALEATTETLLVTTPRLPAVHNTRRTKRLAGSHSHRISGVVVNRAGSGRSPSSDRIADYIGTRVLGEIPDDDNLPVAADAGTPIVVHSPKSKSAVALRETARTFVNVKRTNRRK